MEVLDLNALRQMASDRWQPPPEPTLRPMVFCDLCGAPVAGGIIHRFCPAKGNAPITLLSRSRRRKPRYRRVS
jgi:hypothetical protein